MTRLLMRKPHLKKRYLTEGKKMGRKKEYTLHYWDLMGGKQPHFLSFGVLWPPVGLISRMVWLCLSRPERDRAEQHCVLWLPVVTQLGDGLATWLSHSTKDGEDSPTLTLGLSLSCLWRRGPCALLSAEMQSYRQLHFSPQPWGEKGAALHVSVNFSLFFWRLRRETTQNSPNAILMAPSPSGAPLGRGFDAWSHF